MIYNKKTIFSSFIWRISERFFAQLISLLISTILARLLSPSDNGQVVLLIAFINIADVFVTSGLGSALIQKKDTDDLDYSSILIFNFISSIVIYLIVFFISPLVSRFYDSYFYKSALRVLGIKIIFASINSVELAYVSKNNLFKQYFYSSLFGSSLSGIIGIIMAYKGFGAWSLVIQNLSSIIFTTITIGIIIKWEFKLRFSWERTEKLLSFGWKLLLSSLLDTGYNQFHSLLIGKVYSPDDLAFFSRGDQYPSVVAGNINNAISGVLYPTMSERQNDKHILKEITKKAIQIESYIIWPIMIGFVVCAKPLVVFFLTEKWIGSVPFLQIFALIYGLWPLHTANLQAINSIGRSDLFLKIEIIKKSIGFILFLISCRFGLMAIAVTSLFSGIISYFINSFPVSKILNYKHIEQLQDSFVSLFIALLMGAIIFPIQFLKLSTIAVLIYQIFIGMILYLFFSYIFKVPAFLFLYNTVKEFFYKD